MKPVETKTCERCGTVFVRRVPGRSWYYSTAKWQSIRFCSNRCHSTRPKSDETRRKMAAWRLGRPRPDLLGKPRSPETKARIANGNRGKHLSIETRLKLSESKRGPRHPKWKGGITPVHKALRNGLASWAKMVKERDGYRCVLCGATENLHADHIKPVALYPELIRDLANGRTLCFPCHKKTPTYGGRKMYMVAS